MDYLGALAYYCSPDAECEPEGYRLTQIINLVNAIMPVIVAVQEHQQTMKDFERALDLVKEK